MSYPCPEGFIQRKKNSWKRVLAQHYTKNAVANLVRLKATMPTVPTTRSPPFLSPESLAPSFVLSTEPLARPVVLLPEPLAPPAVEPLGLLVVALLAPPVVEVLVPPVVVPLAPPVVEPLAPPVVLSPEPSSPPSVEGVVPGIVIPAALHEYMNTI